MEATASVVTEAAAEVTAAAAEVANVAITSACATAETTVKDRPQQ